MENTRWNKDIGDAGEYFACEYMAASGYEILERGFRCRMGEIDIIAAKDGAIVFLEVKTRTGTTFGRPAEAVDPRKLTHIKRCAEIYLQRTDRYWDDVRIDVIEIFVNRISCRV